MEQLHAMLRRVAGLVGATLRELLSVRRHHPLVFARHVAAWLLRNCFGLSYPATATCLHQLDHTSAMHGCRQVELELRAGKGPRFELLMDAIASFSEAA